MIPSILVAVVLALPWLTGSWRPGTLGIAWPLHVADRMLDGARYGRDVIEINPPLIAWLMLPVAWVARVAGMQPILAWQGALTFGSAPLSALHPEAEGPGPAIRSADDAAWDGPAPVLRMYADDFVADPPRLLFVPLPDPAGRNRAGHNRSDYLGLLARDPRVRELLGRYRCLDPLAGHAALLRDDGIPSGEWETCGR